MPSGSELNYQQQRAYWYQWFFGSERGREALTDNRRGLCRELWKMWSPTWVFAESEFETAARSWENPDWVEITLHSYRLRLGNASASPRYAELEAKLKTHPAITVPTIHLHGEEDGATLASALKDQSASFSGGYSRRMLSGIGHFIPRERPQAVVDAITGDQPLA